MGVLSPWSISARLLVAFAGVAVLAAAANLIVEQGVSMVAPPPPVIVAQPPAPRVEPVAPAAVIAEEAPPIILTSDELARAVERFDQSVYAAVESDAVEVQARYHQSGKDIEREAAAYIARAQEIANRNLNPLRSVVKQHKAAATRWIELSQQRRKLLRDYAETLGHMNSRVSGSLDGAFKILGRVVARQSLVQLNTNLGALRDSFAAATRAGSTSVEAFNALTTAEASFADTLRMNEKSLLRAEGNDWFAAMETDVGVLAAVRASLGESQSELSTTANSFVEQTAKLQTMTPKIITVKAQPATPAEKAAPRQATEQPPVTAAPDAELTETAPTAAPLAEPVAQTERRAMNRAAVAWISIAVLVLLLLISVATVRSVVNPVRRLIEASRKIATGEAAARVPRGGIKELDTLAVAFNNMADQLAVAQATASEAQHQLEEKVAERTRQLQELAELDPLTGMPNRRHLFTLLNASIEQATRQHSRLGVLFLDVDNFKNINDSVGHTFGDNVLRGIAQRLQEASASLGFAARLGGDEFTIVCNNAASVDDVYAAGEKIIQAFQLPIDVDGRDLIVGVSVGASVFPDHEVTADALLVAADAALFNAKALGRSRVSMFTPELLAGASTKFRIEQDLRRAIERNEFELFFQPEVGIEDLQTHLVEALIRWRLPDGRYVSPGEFLGVAEESGLIMEISDWVLRSAIQAAAGWYRGGWPQARVAVNVSPRQLLDYRFVDRVQQLLTEFDLPPRCIEIELTESVLQTGPSTIEQLHRLRGLGIAIALDDFGTGYSSLASLEQLPLNRVKLDRSLIESIDSNARSRSIVRAITELCHGLGLQLTAEGIERPEQFERLLGCRNLAVQGYLLSRPVPMAQVFTAMAAASQRAQELVLLSKPKLQQPPLPAALGVIEASA